MGERSTDRNTVSGTMTGNKATEAIATDANVRKLQVRGLINVKFMVVSPTDMLSFASVSVPTQSHRTGGGTSHLLQAGSPSEGCTM